MVSTYTYLRFGGRNGVHLHVFHILGPEWCPFTHISILGPGYRVHLHIFQFGGRNGIHLHIFQIGGGRKWCPFTHISNLGPPPRCCLINSVNRRVPIGPQRDNRDPPWRARAAPEPIPKSGTVEEMIFWEGLGGNGLAQIHLWALAVPYG